MKVKQVVAGGVIAGSLGFLPSAFAPERPLRNRRRSFPATLASRGRVWAHQDRWGWAVLAAATSGPWAFHYQGQIVNPAFNGAGWGFGSTTTGYRSKDHLS